MAETSTPTQPTPEAWDEQRIKSSLAQIERLEEHLMALRSTIPSLVTPLLKRDATREEIFVALRKAAVKATSDVKGFREKWEGDAMQGVLKRARDSREKDSDLSAQKEVKRWGWAEGEEKST